MQNSMNFMELVILVFILTWFIITLLVQFSRKLSNSNLVQALDLFMLVPRWSFFAPVPCKVDYHLLYRYNLSDDSFTPWKEYEIENRTHFDWIWHPTKRKRKFLNDCVNELKMSYETSKDKVIFTVAYIIIANTLSSLNSAENSEYIQFLIMESDTPDLINEAKPIFTSELHKL
jgi:hypothetical protein